MKIAIIAASGKAGNLIVEDALKRKYDVTAIVRDASKVIQDIPVVEKDILSIKKEDLQPFDVVINAFGAKESDPIIY